MYRVFTEHFSEWLFGLVCDQAKRCPWRCSVASRFSSLCFLLRPPSGAGRFCRCGGGGVPADFGAGFFSQLFLGKFRGLQSRGAASSPARRTQPGTVGQEVRDLFRELVDLGNGLASLVRQIIEADSPMPGVPISLLIFLRGPVRGMPRNLEPVPLLPHFFPDIGVASFERSALGLCNGRFTVGSDCCTAIGVAQEEGECPSFALHHIAACREHLRNSANLSQDPAFKSTGHHRNSHNTRAGVVGGAGGIGAEDQVSDHGGNRAFDQGPPFGGFEQLFPGDLPQAEVLRRHGLGEEQLVQGAPVLQNHRLERVAAVTFP
eukprot:s7125_g3.t1